MLRVYSFQADQLVALPERPADEAEQPIIWLDLLKPAPDENEWVQRRVGIEIPTRAEMEEIEPSARLYSEDGAEFMTVSAVTELDGDEPVKTPVTFILRGSTLVTVRYADPKPFTAFAQRAQRSRDTEYGTGERVMLGLIEAMVDRLADTLERTGSDIDAMSRGIFRKTDSKFNKKTRDLQSMIEQIGAKAEALSMMQEGLVSIVRLVAYHVARDRSLKARKDTNQLFKLVQRDATSLGDHARALSSKVNFLLDATLGLINLEQNQIIKIFSVAAVVFLPPTLVASIYGMNFDIMPELHWFVGYPWALVLMVASAAGPYLYFKRRGWL